jgi:3-hydroxybutyryl-CoA dehydrogenase
VSERVAIAGSGAIACGLAAVAAECGDVVVWARSDESAERAADAVEAILERSGDTETGEVTVTSDRSDLLDATFLVEAIVEDHDAKADLLAELGRQLDNGTVLATTTSSLSVAELATASGRPERFVGLHVFNPVHRMALVELVFPDAATEDTRRRARELCEALGKTAVEVPDVPGFVVNRLLFPYLFSAVRLIEETGLSPEAVDQCMTLGTGHPMGPLALLDLVGLDVSQAIGRTIGAEIPKSIDERVTRGALGRKTGQGFYSY